MFYLNEVKHCYDQTGLESKNGIYTSTHLSYFIWSNKEIPEDDSSKFAAIWILIILFNILMGVLLFVSFVACLIKYNADYAWSNKYNVNEDYDDDDVKSIHVGVVNVNNNIAAANDDDNSDNGSDASYITKAKSKRGAKSRAGASSEVTVIRTLNRSSKQPCILKYLISFFIKHPLLNPIIAKHERVNRFSRGLIHYTGLSAMLLIIVCWLNGIQWVNSRWRSAIFCLFVNFAFGRIWNFVMYNLHAWDTKGLRNFWIIITILNFIIFIGVWIFIHFAASWLEWTAFKNIWWLAPMSLLVEFIWEVVIDIPHVLLAD